MYVCVCVARDNRREGMLIGGTNKKKTVRYQLDVTAQDDVVRLLIFVCHVTNIARYSHM